MKGSLPLDFPRRRARSLAVLGGTFGFVGLGAPLAIGLVRASGVHGPLALALHGIALVLALGLSIAIPPWLLRRRAPREARLEWDRDAIVERDGDAVRTCIRWIDARVRTEPGIVQITDAAGRAITVAEHARTPPWLARRRASADDLSELIARAVDRDPGPPIAPDDRDAQRPVMGRQVAVATFALAVLGIPALAFAIPALAVPFAALCMTILCALPTLRPLHELAALLEEGRHFDRTVEATVEEPEITAPIVRNSEATWVRLDLSRARHPDALLGMREDARIRLVLPLSGWVAAPTRATIGQAIAPEAIETLAEADARADRLRAVLLELLVRGAAIALWAAMSLSPLWLE